ncbi:MAG: SufD family Fe-S cluster assembly protein [Myxococcota bacterium]
MKEVPHVRMLQPDTKGFRQAEQHIAFERDTPTSLNTLQASFGKQQPLQAVVFVDGYAVPKSTTYRNVYIGWAPRDSNHILQTQLEIDDSMQTNHPLLLLHLATQDQCRMNALVELTVPGNSRLQLLECHASGLNPSYFCRNTLKIQLQPHSQLHHVRLLHNSREGQYKLNTQVHQQSNSSYCLHEISLSGTWRSSRTHVHLEQPNAQCHLQALDVGQRQQCSYHQMTVHHKAPHCSSRQLHKGLYTGQARGIFEGQTVVNKQAVHTKAHQLSRSVLLSEHAQAYSQPQLQIETDEVQCGHGATVSQLDEKALFYLQSRGIERHRAQQMLTEAFTQEVLQTIKPVWLRIWLQQRMQNTINALT